MSNGKKQSLIIIGISMILIGFILGYFSLTQPKVYVAYNSTSNSANSSEDASYPINLNTCTVEELMTIDGIGQAKASAIIEYREYIGEYESISEIKNIRGISDQLYEKLEPYLCV